MISFCRKDLRITNVSERVPILLHDIFGLLGPYFSGFIFSVLWVTFDPTSCKYADHQNRWIAKDSPHVVLGPYFGCRQVSLFIKSWVPIFKFVFLSLQEYPEVLLFFSLALGWRVSSKLRLSEFVQISEFFSSDLHYRHLSDIWVICQSVNLKQERTEKGCPFSKSLVKWSLSN